jgi:uncharacterized OsmC-like protein
MVGSTCDDRRMDTATLREIQRPIKDAYRDDPSLALITLRAHGAVGEGVTCSVTTGHALARAGLHPASGGDGASLCSGDMLLEALVACAGVTLAAVSTALGIEMRSGEVTAEGDLDFRGTLAVDRDVPVGFRSIRLAFELDTDASDEEVGKLIALTERYCVVYQTIVAGTAVELTHTRLAH